MIGIAVGEPLIRRLICGIASCALAGVASAAPPSVATDVGTPANLTKALDDLLARKRAELHLPAAALAVIRNGQLVYERAIGLRDVEHQRAATIRTIFPIGSATKSFTAMAVALAEDQGRLTLEDHPRAFLPYFRMYDPEADARVTIRDLLCHRTGIMSANELAAQSAQISRDDLVRVALAAQPTQPFRSTFQYSNVGYVAVGQVLERAYGEPWEAVIREQILVPLAMTSSVASLTERARFPDYALGYSYDAKAERWVLTPYHKVLEVLAAAGMIGASLDDLTHWLGMLTEGGVFRGHRFVSAALFRELITPEIIATARSHLRTSYALGWATYDLRGARVVEHNGGSAGISALVSFMPERHTGFVFLANTSPTAMTQIGNAAQLIYPLVLTDLTGTTADLPTAARVPDPSSAPLPTVTALHVRMLQAAGGEQALRRHDSLELKGSKSYDNMGVTAQVRVLARAPAQRLEEEALSAAGQNVGRIRAWFDGQKGGQEVSFQGADLDDEAANRAHAVANALHPLLHLSELFTALEVTGYDHIALEPVYVLKGTPAAGEPFTYFVSVRTARILRRESAGESTDYSDFRRVDGEYLPFITVTRDASGVSTFHVQSAEFNVPVPPGSFAPEARAESH